MEVVNIQKASLRNTKNSMQSRCGYCANFLNPEILLIQRDPWDTVLYESDNFVVVPTLGAIVEGWLLIVTKQHILCMGALQHSVLEELQSVIDFVYTVLSSVYLPPTVFEHGPCTAGENVGCGVDHAHLHVVPLQFDLLESAKYSSELHDLKWTQTPSGLHDIQDLYSQMKSYLYIKSPSSASYVCPVSMIPCQSLRRIIAKESGLESRYDYRKHPFTKNVQATVSALNIIFNDSRYKSFTKL